MNIDYYKVSFVKNGLREEPTGYIEYDKQLHLKAIFYEMFHFLKTTDFKFTHRNYNKNRLLLELIPSIYYLMDIPL